MITEKELLEAIAECESEPPSYTSLKKLASLYIVLDHLHAEKIAAPKTTAKNDSEFMRTISGKNIEAVLGIMDELMETLSVLYPKAYESVLFKIRRIK